MPGPRRPRPTAGGQPRGLHRAEGPDRVWDAVEVARHLGVATEPMLRWTGHLNRGPEAEFWRRAGEFKLEAYYSVTAAGLGERLHRWRQWISQHGPLMIVVATDSSLLAGDRVLS